MVSFSFEKISHWRKLIMEMPIAVITLLTVILSLITAIVQLLESLKDSEKDDD